MANRSKGYNRLPAIIASVLVSIIVTSSLTSLPFIPTAEGNVVMIRHSKDHQNNTSLKVGAVEKGTATFKINTNVYPDSSCGGAVKPCPDNKDMSFGLLTDQNLDGVYTEFYSGTFRGSPDTITLKVPVAKSGTTIYRLQFNGPAVIDVQYVGQWKIGDTSVRECNGLVTDGQVVQCTLNIHYGWY